MFKKRKCGKYNDKFQIPEIFSDITMHLLEYKLMRIKTLYKIPG